MGTHPRIAFIGGGSMATALISGLVKQGFGAQHLHVVEPFEAARDNLRRSFGIDAACEADDALSTCDLLVWAVKPQQFEQAALAAGRFAQQALHLSVAAGIPVQVLSGWLQTPRVVRAMPNTPALIGQGMTGLYAPPNVSADDRTRIEQLLSSTGRCLWVEKEALIDAVTAVSGSGPAYVFYWMESMLAAGLEMGLTPEQARTLTLGTMEGAAALAAASSDDLATLRERVTSKGGTTFAALNSMMDQGLQPAIVRAMWAAHRRAGEMSQEFGASQG
ncbi:pyrroline-5-carboxylate reductase [Variovorax sp. HJSM1_2]|uniref:pyrroline-5-carboxylate reductase n=1 Tax=Variovorax sp. HJSM1_2 TaxID=3366263 RepID=UPI003BCF01E6